MRVFVLGSGGFLGSNIVKKLIAHGHSVVAARRNQSNFSRIETHLNAIDFIDIEGLRDFSKIGQLDAVINCAVLYDKDDSIRWRNVFDVNVNLPLDVFNSVCSNKHFKFIQFDTFYSLRSNLNYENLSLYVNSKKTLRKWLCIGANERECDVYNIYLNHMYGQYDNSNKFVPHVIDMALNNRNIFVSNPNELRDFVYVDDVVDNVVDLLCSSSSNKYNEHMIGTGIYTSLHDFVQIVYRECSSTGIITHAELSPDPVLYHRQVPYNDVEKIKYSLTDGIRKMIYQCYA